MHRPERLPGHDVGAVNIPVTDTALVESPGRREWPPRLPSQPIFYPVLNEEYATRIARDWNVPAPGSSFVTRFEVRRSFLDPLAKVDHAAAGQAASKSAASGSVVT